MVERGEVWWAELPDPRGSEPGFRRPVLIVQHDAFNRSRLRTVLAVALTGNLRLVEAPGNVLLPAGTTGLTHDTCANVTQVVTLDRAFLSRRAGRLHDPALREVERGLRLVLGLETG